MKKIDLSISQNYYLMLNSKKILDHLKGYSYAKKSFLQISTIISKSTIGFLIQSGMAGAGPGF